MLRLVLLRARARAQVLACLQQASAEEEEESVRAHVERVVVLLGRYVAPDAYLPMLLPAVQGTVALQTPGQRVAALRVLALLLGAVTEPALVAPHLAEVGRGGVCARRVAAAAVGLR